ncbi:MAG: sugar phosphate isomerase/epimerase [Flavisolibacter sp.]|jgi:sugar phosphate isomerase/epimerase|nr:sugar phosphate isomerase/epimerase [Flavisolibacter sp.]
MNLNLKTSVLLFVFAIVCNTKDVKAQNTPESFGWKLGAQTYSFRLFTLEEALNKADSIGIKYVEGFPGQKIGAGIGGTMDYHMTAAKRDSVLQLFKKKGITMVSYGVVTPANENDWTQLFEFAKGMGLKQFASEPEPEFIPLISKLADQYQVNVAFHNHPRPSRYWSPDTLLKYTAGYSKRLGSCADIGHWVRSGLDPVEMLKKLQGRIFESHMKDLHEKPSAEYAAFLLSRPLPGKQQVRGNTQPPAGPHDVPWGTGVSNIKAVLEELKRQGFKGPLFAEYEFNWANNAPEIAESLKYVREVAGKMK